MQPNHCALRVLDDGDATDVWNVNRAHARLATEAGAFGERCVDVINNHVAYPHRRHIEFRRFYYAAERSATVLEHRVVVSGHRKFFRLPAEQAGVKLDRRSGIAGGEFVPSN